MHILINIGTEECDCGGAEYCINPCCNPLTCKLIPNAQCSDGPCCHSCKLQRSGTACRTPNNECDISDICDGISASCRNIYKENGLPCDGNHGICYDGKCKSRNAQCQYNWGSPTVDGHPKCYDMLNNYGKYFGHCGEVENSFTKCKHDNIYCGLLQCTNIANIQPVIGTFRRHSKVDILVGSVLHQCMGASVDLGRQQSDPGKVILICSIISLISSQEIQQI